VAGCKELREAELRDGGLDENHSDLDVGNAEVTKQSRALVLPA
jgi:hypothetical protein